MAQGTGRKASGGGRMSDKATQRTRILNLLLSKPWVLLPEILDLRIASYTRRISELREMGYDIRCETRYVDGVKSSRYHLEAQKNFWELYS